MSTMTGKEMIEGSAFVRQVIGFVKLGVMIHPSMRAMAQDKFKALLEQDALDPRGVPSVARVLDHLRTGLLSDESLCRQAMTEIDEFLLPMRRDQRAHEAMLAEPDEEPVRERQRG